jgi:hypothetical protein
MVGRKMNERIKELMKEANKDVPLGKDFWLGLEQFSEKFAELFVRECVEQLRYTVLDTQELRRDKSTDYQVGWEDGMFDAEEMIKAHFGVEE